MPGPGQPTELFGHPSKVVQDTWAIVQRLEEDRGLHQIVNVADHVTHGHDLSRLVARCLISSSYVVLKMPGMTYDEHDCFENYGKVFELGRVMGREKVGRLFFRPRTPA
jgi:hypothetical protein